MIFFKLIKFSALCPINPFSYIFIIRESPTTITTYKNKKFFIFV